MGIDTYLQKLYPVVLVTYFVYEVKRWRYLCICLDRHWGLQEVEAPRIFRLSTHEGGKDVSFTHQLLSPTRKDPWYSFLLEAESTTRLECSQKDRSMKNLKYPIENWTCYLPACSTVSVLSVLPHTYMYEAPLWKLYLWNRRAYEMQEGDKGLWVLYQASATVLLVADVGCVQKNGAIRSVWCHKIFFIHIWLLDLIYFVRVCTHLS
jgi:hypothetical protein